MNAIIYCRVSTKEQEDQGFGMDVQERDCLAYAERNGLNVVAVLREDYTGTTLNRPEFNKLKQMLASGLAEAVVIHRGNRLSRDHVDTMYQRRKFFDAGIALHFADRGQDSPDFAGDAMAFFDGRSGQQDNEDRTRATRGGRIEKAMLGKYVCSGPAPYGYRYEYVQTNGPKPKAELRVNEPEAEVVRLIFQLYTRGNGTGRPLSLRRISDHLNREGDPLLPPSRKKSTAGYWQPTTIRRILLNELYAGVAYYHKTHTEKGVRSRVPREEWIPIPLSEELAIVPRPAWRAAQKRLQHNQQNRKYDYLLTGFLRCGVCGYALTGHTKTVRRKRHVYKYQSYRCARKEQPGEAACPNKHRRIPANLLEPSAWEWMERNMSDLRYFNQGLQRMIERRNAQIEPLQDKLAFVEREIESVDHQLSRLTLDWASDDTIVQAAFQREANLLADQRRLLEAERRQLEAQLNDGGMTEKLAAVMERLRKKYERKLDKIRPSTKRLILDRLNVVAIVHRDENENLWMEISCGLPESDEVITLTPL